MAVQHEDAMFDLDEAPFEDNSINQITWQMVNENTGILNQNNGLVFPGNMVRHTVTPNNKWVLMPEAYYQCQCQVVAITAGVAAALTPATAPGVAIAFANAFPIFDTLTMTVDGVTVQNTGQFLHRNALMKRFIDYSDATTASSFVNNLWIPDTGLGQTDTAENYIVTTTPSIVFPGAPAIPVNNPVPEILGIPSASLISTLAQSTTNPYHNQGFTKRIFYDFRTINATAAGLVSPYLPPIANAAPALSAQNGTTTQLATYNRFPTLQQDWMNVKIPLRELIDFYRFYDKVLTGSEISIQATFNQNINQLFVASGALAAGVTLGLQIRNLFLWVPYVTPSPLVGARLAGYLDSSFSNIVDYESVETQQCNTSQIVASLYWPVTAKTNGRLTRVIIGLQHPNQQNNPNYTWNWATFSAMMGTTFTTTNWWAARGGQVVVAAGVQAPVVTGSALLPGDAADSTQIQSISLTYGGLTIPQSMYQPTNFGLVNNYEEWLRVCGRERDYEAGSCISSKDYSQCLTLYAFDLRMVDVGASGGLANSFTVNLNTTGPVAGNPNNINIFATIFTECKMRVSANGNKITYQQL